MSSAKRNFQPSQGKTNKTINLLTIFSYPTNKKPETENEKSWISEKLTKNSKFYSKLTTIPTPVSITEVKNKTLNSENLKKESSDVTNSNFARIRSTSLAYNHRPNISTALYTTENTSSLLKDNFEKVENKKSKKNNLFYSFIDFDNDNDDSETYFDRNDNRYSTFTKKTKSSKANVEDKKNTKVENTSTKNSENESRVAQAQPLNSNYPVAKRIHEDVPKQTTEPKIAKFDDSNKYLDEMLKDAKLEAEKPYEDAKRSIAKVEEIKRPSNLNFQKVYTANLSLPDSPISESVSQISPVDNGHCFTDSEMIKPDEKTKKRGCSFYVDLKSVKKAEIDIDKKIAERNQKEKERLLMTHDQLNCENSNLKISENRSIESLLEEFEERSDGEFSSDSLESESLGTKPPRRCVSDFQIFSKESKTYPRSLSLCSQQKSYNEELSDTDFSGLNSLQGSGDLLEMQENDSDFERLDNFGRHSSASFFLNRSVYKSTESVLTDESECDRIGRSIDNILEIGSHERIEKLFRHVERKNPNHQSRTTVKKPDAFFIEFDESPRKHKPILRAKSLPVKRNNEKLSVSAVLTPNDGVKTKPPTAPKPVVSCDKNSKVSQLAKKLSLKCNQQVLPSKITQGTNSCY